MSLSKTAVKNAILTVLESNMTEENPEISRDNFADNLADSICDAIKDGIESTEVEFALTAGPYPVAGTITLTLTITP